MRWKTGICLGMCLALYGYGVQAQETQTTDYWRGWCAGRRAGLAHASRYVHATFEAWIAGWKASGDPMKERLELLLHVVPFTSFGPPLDMPFTVELSDGRTIACPSGEILVTPPLERKG